MSGSVSASGCKSPGRLGFIILNARHLKRTLASYFSYYHGSRTHLGLDQQCPFPRQVSGAGRIVQMGVDLILDIDLKLREQPSVAGEVLVLRPAPIGH
jgi:hypothetical protein